MMKHRCITSAILLLTVLLFTACPGGKCDHDGSYEFKLPATLAPAIDTFRIGDTIHVASMFPDDVLDINSGVTYKLKDFKFYPGTSLVKIDSNPAVDALDFFEVMIPEAYEYAPHRYSNGDNFLIGEYKYENNLYSLSFSIIPKVPGLYMLSQGSSLYPSGRWQSFPEKCSYIAMDASIALNNDADNNIHYLSLSPDPHYNDWILREPDFRFHKFGGYCFVVVE